MTTNNIRDQAELHGGIIKENTSGLVSEAIASTPGFYSLRTTKVSINGRPISVSSILAERVGAYAFVQDFSGLGGFMNSQKYMVDYAFWPDDRLYIW